MTSAADTINAAFLGTIIATAPIVKALLQRAVPLNHITGAEKSLQALKIQIGKDDPLPRSVVDLPAHLSSSEGRSHPQHQLSNLVHKANQASLFANIHSPRDQLRLSAVTRPRAGLWLSALPVKQLGLKFDKQEFVALLRWWLGLSVLLPDPCPEPKCPHSLDIWGDHAVVCPCGPSRIARHDAVNHVWAHCLKSAGFHVTKEVHCDPDSQRRSADTLVDSWQFGRQCAHDWIITHTLQSSALARRSPDPAVPLVDAETHKISYAKANCEKNGIDFLPLAADTFGGFGPQAELALHKVTKDAQLLRGDSAPPAVHLRQRLQVAVLRGVARQLLRRITHHELQDGDF